MPSASISTTALSWVRPVVPKPGMVIPTMPVRGNCNLSKALAATSSARVLSSPPDTPITTLLQPIAANRRASPAACILIISSHRPESNLPSAGTNGWRFTGLINLSLMQALPSSKSTMRYGLRTVAAQSSKLVTMRRSFAICSISTSAIAISGPSANRSLWAMNAPFSATMAFPANIRSVDDSPNPAEAYTYTAMQRADCCRTRSHR